MADKIIISPTRVRAYGNIINVKSDDDYELVDCTITESTATINGVSMGVYLMEPDLGEATSLTVTSSSSTLVLDGTVTISATLKDSSNVAINGATITFKEGSTTLGTGTTNSSGVATYTYTGATTGSHTVSGVFGGDSTYASSTGSVSLTVNKKSTSTALTTSSASVTVGTSVTLTATVTSGGSGVNGLTVLFKDGTSTLGTGTTNSSGVATYTTSSLTEGTHSITAVVTETSTYSTSTSSAVSVVVSSTPAYIINDDASVNNRDTLFGSSSIALRNSGTSTMTWTSASPSYYQVKVTKSNSDSFIEYLPLRGVTDSFKLTIKYRLPATNYYSYVGLYYYIDSNNWGGVKGLNDAQWVSSKTNGTFTEQEYRTGQSLNTNYFTNEIVYDKTANTLAISTYDSSDNLIQSKTMNIPITLTSSVKWGTGVAWSNTDRNNIYLIKAEYI